jgi:thiaminase
VQKPVRSDMREGFTGELWHSIEGIYEEILAHPFLRGLTNGTLPKECFRYYVLQVRRHGKKAVSEAATIRSTMSAAEPASKSGLTKTQRISAYFRINMSLKRQDSRRSSCTRFQPGSATDLPASFGAR